MEPQPSKTPEGLPVPILTGQGERPRAPIMARVLAVFCWILALGCLYMVIYAYLRGHYWLSMAVYGIIGLIGLQGGIQLWRGIR